MFSGATLAAGPKYQTAGLPMISPSATNPDITNLGTFIWRICITDAVQGKGLADYTVNNLGLKNIAIMYDDSDYGRGLADATEAAAKAIGGTVVDKEQYTSGDTDFKPQLTKIKAGNPELIFLSGYYPEGSKIASRPVSSGSRPVPRLRRLRVRSARQPRRRGGRRHARFHLLRLHQDRTRRSRTSLMPSRRSSTPTSRTGSRPTPTT